jgi:tetraacyldisaccharide 4'-kinase
LKRFLTIFLFPFAIIYDIITRCRNLFYDFGIFKSYEIPVFSIGVGNLSAGGTGKTPFISYLINQFENKQIAVLSRGYGRKTTGYLEVNENSSPTTVGDEIFMLFEKHKSRAKFFVCENRKIGVQNLLEKYPEIDVILLDDAYQHRGVKPLFQVLLSRFDKPFFEDYLIPFGRLREARKGANRSDVIICTKTQDFSLDKEMFFKNGVSNYKKNGTPVFFTYQLFDGPSNMFGETIKIGGNVKVLSALADNDLFVNQISKDFKVVKAHLFPDHFAYKSAELMELIGKEPIITSEKDFVKIKNLLAEEILKWFYVQKLEIRFEKEEDEFLTSIKKQFKRFQEKKGSLNIG